MKTKGVSYHLENDLMVLKYLGCYRVTTENNKQNCNLIASLRKVIEKNVSVIILKMI